MTVFMLVAICGVAGAVVGLGIVGLILLARAGSRDSVGAAREDWITRRSDNDERGW